MKTAAAGLIGFLLGCAACLAVWFALFSIYFGIRPAPTEAYEGFGDVVIMFGGLLVALPTSIAAGFLAGFRAADRFSRSRSPK